MLSRSLDTVYENLQAAKDKIHLCWWDLTCDNSNRKGNAQMERAVSTSSQSSAAMKQHSPPHLTVQTLSQYCDHANATALPSVSLFFLLPATSFCSNWPDKEIEGFQLPAYFCNLLVGTRALYKNSGIFLVAKTDTSFTWNTSFSVCSRISREILCAGTTYALVQSSSSKPKPVIWILFIKLSYDYIRMGN